MNACDTIRRLHQHRAWVNERLLQAAGELSHDQLHQPCPIGQGSIWKTLTHLMAAEYVWLEALLGNESPLMPGDVAGELPGNQQGDNAIQSLAELTARWMALDARWIHYLAELGDDSLNEKVVKTSTSSGFGKRHATTRVDVLLHVCTHAQYTSAQLINMLRQVGHSNLPDVMMITLARTKQETL